MPNGRGSMGSAGPALRGVGVNIKSMEHENGGCLETETVSVQSLLTPFIA